MMSLSFMPLRVAAEAGAFLRRTVTMMCALFMRTKKIGICRSFQKRDVIEIPISDELDIVGWDVKKAMYLAAKGNVVIHEWLNTPIVYQSNEFAVWQN